MSKARVTGCALAASWLCACGAPEKSAPPPNVVAATNPAPQSFPPPPYGTKEKLASLVDAYAAGFGASWGPGYAPTGYVLVARAGEPVVSRAFGVANPKTNAPADVATRFRIGSLTKQFTAVATLQLARDKKLALTDSVRRWVPSLPAAFDGVTLMHLLSQTSGIASYTEDESLMRDRDKPAEPRRVLATFADKPLAFAPGSQFQYSNSNYYLLGLVIERASGTTYEQYLQAKVLGPAGMTRTSTVDAPDAPDTAVGRTLDDNDELATSGPIDLGIPFAAGALRSTAHDLVLWDAALRDHTLLDADSEKLRVTPVKDDYALGVLRESQQGHEVEWHNGGIDGFSSYLARVPDLGLVVVVLMNSDAFSTDKFATGILRMALDGKPVAPPTEPKELPFDAAAADAIAGDYAISEESKSAVSKMLPKAVVDSVLTMSITTDGRKLSMKPVGQSSLVLHFGQNGAFFTKKAGVVVTPTKDGLGKVTGVTLRQGRLEIDYVRQLTRPMKR